jgi:hypothetical protein
MKTQNGKKHAKEKAYHLQGLMWRALLLNVSFHVDMMILRLRVDVQWYLLKTAILKLYVYKCISV